MSRRRPKQRPSPGPVPPSGTRRWLWIVVTILVLGTALVAGALRQRRPTVESPRRDNLLLVTLDTTRADRLGCYGYARAKTRHLDRLAAEGVRFAQALSPAPITLPAHASIFTGLYPFAHGVRNNGNFYLGDSFETLATVLQKYGYRTAAFVSSFILDRRYGLARGFETYDDRIEGAKTQVISLEAERRGDRTSLALEAWLASHAERKPHAPFFAWLHLYDPHEPYRPPPPFRDLFKDSPYDGEVAFDDAIVAAVLDRLGRLGLRDNTLVAVIGDHGESLGDHGEETHSMFVYESAIRVPFILWGPGVVPARLVVEEPVRATDLASTLLDLLGAPPLATTHGRSLVPLLRGTKAGPTPPVYAETLLPRFHMNWAPLLAIRDERWKLIAAPRPELYDLRRDPAETMNLYDQERERARALRQSLERLTGGAEGAMSVGTLDREAIEKLAALGYVGAGAEPGSDPQRAQADPKDVIAVFNRLRRANSAVRDRRFAEALPILRDVLRDDPKNAFARVVMGSAHMGMGRYQEAIVWFRKYLELVPTSAYAHHWMAICHLRQGTRNEALREAAAALAIDPRFADARVLRGGVMAARGDYSGAIAELRAAVATDPAKPILRLDLAKVLAEAGRPAEAQSEYEAALRIRHDYAPAFVGLGVLQAQRGEFESALHSFSRALEVNPRDDEVRFNRARALEGLGRKAEAQAEYRLLAEGPETPPAIRLAAGKRVAAGQPLPESRR